MTLLTGLAWAAIVFVLAVLVAALVIAVVRAVRGDSPKGAPDVDLASAFNEGYLTRMADSERPGHVTRNPYLGPTPGGHDE